MALKTKWVVVQMDTAPSEDTLQDVVKRVHYRYEGTDEQYFADIYGVLSCETPSETDFTAYKDLTYEQVCTWLDAGLDVEAIDLGLDAQIENIINPPIIVLPLPWTNPNN